jgi:hypothetical protein
MALHGHGRERRKKSRAFHWRVSDEKAEEVNGDDTTEKGYASAGEARLPDHARAS